MANVGRTRLPVLLAFPLLAVLCPQALAKPTFSSSEIHSPASEILTCDLDGDGVNEMVLIAGTNLTVLFQDSKREFGNGASPTVSCTHCFQGQPSLLCS